MFAISTRSDCTCYKYTNRRTAHWSFSSTNGFRKTCSCSCTFSSRMQSFRWSIYGLMIVWSRFVWKIHLKYSAVRSIIGRIEYIFQPRTTETAFLLLAKKKKKKTYVYTYDKKSSCLKSSRKFVKQDLEKYPEWWQDSYIFSYLRKKPFPISPPTPHKT